VAFVEGVEHRPTTGPAAEAGALEMLAHGLEGMAVIRLQHQEVVGGLRPDPRGDLLLASHGVEPISTATAEGTVQWLLHRRMGANQQIRWSPRGAHRMLKVRTPSVANGTLAEDHAAAEPWARRPFRPAA
jgi:hypothetical protein